MNNYFIQSEHPYKINGGDGDQSFFGEEKVLKVISTSWFDGFIWGQEAYLFEIEGGSMNGNFVAVTSRWEMSVTDQLIKNGIASVVVHLIQKRSQSSSPNNYDIDSIGMSVLEKYTASA